MERGLEPDAEYIRRIIHRSGRTVAEFARGIDFNLRTLRRMLSGSPVAASSLRILAGKLDMPWEDLLSEAARKKLATHIGPRTRSRALMGQPAPCQLPAVLADFVGREREVQDLGSCLSGTNENTGRIVLHGMGGIGKTSLAVRIAHNVKRAFPDAQIFLELEGMSERPLSPAKAMAILLAGIEPGMASIPKTKRELLPRYRAALAGKRALIVLDNAADENQVSKLIDLPSPVAIVVTSRRALALDGVKTAHVQGLRERYAFQLLRSILGKKGTDEELQSIIALCHGLPLALRVAGDFLRIKSTWTAERFKAALEREGVRRLKVGTDPEKDVEAVLKLSAQQLVRDNEDLGRKWHLLHVFAGDFDANGVTAAWKHIGKNDDVLDDLSTLVDRSLLLFDPKADRYRLHDLMKPIAEGLFQ
jgi:hypothetical protein